MSEICSFLVKKNEKAGNRSYNFCPCSTRLLPIKSMCMPIAALGVSQKNATLFCTEGRLICRFRIKEKIIDMLLR